MKLIEQKNEENKKSFHSEVTKRINDSIKLILIFKVGEIFGGLCFILTLMNLYSEMFYGIYSTESFFKVFLSLLILVAFKLLIDDAKSTVSTSLEKIKSSNRIDDQYMRGFLIPYKKVIKISDKFEVELVESGIKKDDLKTRFTKKTLLKRPIKITSKMLNKYVGSYESRLHRNKFKIVLSIFFILSNIMTAIILLGFTEVINIISPQLGLIFYPDFLSLILIIFTSAGIAKLVDLIIYQRKLLPMKMSAKYNLEEQG